MKNTKLIYLVAGLMAISVPQLARGEDAKPTQTPEGRQELREKLQKLSPEQEKEFREKHPEAAAKYDKRRDEALKELGLNHDELKKLPESKRREKVKEATDKKLTELQKKKADGTITDSEKETLQRLEQRKKMLEGQRGDGGKRPGKPGAEKPADK